MRSDARIVNDASASDTVLTRARFGVLRPNIGTVADATSIVATATT